MVRLSRIAKTLCKIVGPDAVQVNAWDRQNSVVVVQHGDIFPTERTQASLPWPGRLRPLRRTVFSRIDRKFWRVALEGDAPGVTVLVNGTMMHRRDGEFKLPSSTAVPTPRRARTAKAARAPKRSARTAPVARPRSKSAELDDVAAAGHMPEKPIVTSRANLHYQKRFDRLAEWAAAGDWDAIAAYEVKGKNTLRSRSRHTGTVCWRRTAPHLATPA